MAPRTPELGDNLARIRRRRGLTQEQLAEHATVSVSVIRKLERADRDSASLPTLHKLAKALGVTTVDLFAPVPRFDERVDVDDRADMFAIRRALQPARTLSGASVPSLADDGEPPTLDGLRGTVREINGMFRDSDYAGAVATLPTALAHARRTIESLDGDDRTAAWMQMAQAYQTAAMVLIQLRREDLAWTALGEAMNAGRAADDDTLVAAAVCTENWLLTRQGRFDEAETAALSSAEAIEPSLTRSPLAQVAVFGWLNLGAASAAARNNRPDVAADALRRARAAAYVAAPFEAPDVQHWTSLSPPVVAVREVELAMVTGDVDSAMRSARDVPDDLRPAVTHQRFQLDVAAAYTERREYDEALAVLLQLRVAVPGWLRYQRYARSIADRLLHARPRSVPAELRELAEFLDLAA